MHYFQHFLCSSWMLSLGATMFKKQDLRQKGKTAPEKIMAQKRGKNLLL